MNPVVAILKELKPVFSELNRKMRGVDSREFRRWFKGKTEPSGESAQKVAFCMWDDLDLKNNSAAREKIFRKIESVVPDAPCHSWREDEKFDRSAFGDWFFRLADSWRGGGGPKEPLTLTTVEVLVAPLGARQPADFTPVTSNVLPVKAEQLLRIRITPSRPAYIYVLWINTLGIVETNFPWKVGPSDECRCDDLAVEQEQQLALLELPLPSVVGSLKAWSFDKSRGWETLVALARENPLQSKERKEMLRRLKAKLPAADAKSRISPGPHPFELIPIRTRGINSVEVTLNDPVLARHQTVAARLGPCYDAGQCLSFLHS
ncbi:MAG: hypothetical protein U1F83_04805 [Verrucomicrobiota bacterium]